MNNVVFTCLNYVLYFANFCINDGTRFFYKERYFSIQLHGCLTFSWIETKMLLRCRLIQINIIIVRHFLYLLFVFCSRPTVSFMMFWDFSMFYQIFLSPQVKRRAIIRYKHAIYELAHELPKDLRLRNIEMS